MYYYSDLQNSNNRGEFCLNAVKSWRTTPEYRAALDGERYYAGHNTTIERFQKLMYTLRGQQIVDTMSANYKIKTRFFKRAVTNLTQYVLGNGVQVENKEALGKDIDYKLQSLVTRAFCAGKAYAYWTGDRIEVFSIAETPTLPGFCPLYDLRTGKLRAGIRFYTRVIGDKELTYYSLFEEDGITEYKSLNGLVEQLSEKQPYAVKVQTTKADGVVSQAAFDLYSSLPIIPIVINDSHESELTPIRDAVDAYDLILSGLGNNIDDFSSVYWVIKNAGGMDDPDIARLMQRLKTVHGACVDGDIEMQSFAQDVPVDARERMLKLLKENIYQDMMCVDLDTLSVGNKTATELKLAYSYQDQRAAEIEYHVIKFINDLQMLLQLPEETPTFKWQRVINVSEETNAVLSAALYLPRELLIKKLPFLTSDEVEEALEGLKNEELDIFNQTTDDVVEE